MCQHTRAANSVPTHTNTHAPQEGAGYFAWKPGPTAPLAALSEGHQQLEPPPPRQGSARTHTHTHTHTHFAHTAVSGPLVILGQQSMPLQHSLCWVGPETWRHLVTWELFAWYLRVACIRLGLPHITPLPQHTTPNPNLCLGGTHACPPARNVTAASGQQHGLMHSTAGHAVQPATTQADITA
jgi:hypothetical protein